LLDDADDKELMYWHVTKGLKAAVKNKQVEFVAYLIDELQVSLDHEAFDKYLHLFLFGCQEANMLDTTEACAEAHVENRQLLKLLVKGKGRDKIDELDNVNKSTPLMIACELLSDMELFRILCE